VYCELGDIAYCVSDCYLWCEKLLNTISHIKKHEACLIIDPQPNSAYATVLTKNLKYGKVLKSLFVRQEK
jgi:hypothetical protein